MSVSPLKFSKNIFSIESLVILSALIIFVSSVSLLIYYKYVRRSYHNCYIEILPSVSSLMSYKITLRIESLATLVALVRFVSSVCPHMGVLLILCDNVLSQMKMFMYLLYNNIIIKLLC